MDLSIDGARQEDSEYLFTRKGELIGEIIETEDILSVTTEVLDRVKYVYEDAGLRDMWLEISRIAFTKKMIALARGASFNKYTRASALKELARMGEKWPGLLELLKFSEADMSVLANEIQALS